MTTRTIERTILGIKTSDGAGVKLKRLIGTPMLRSLDPFLMLDDFGSDEPNDYLAGFPDHPHRGFETITYMVEGKFRHKDNKGHEGVLETGGAQWMTAGRGIVHSEMPIQKEGRVRGLQLWLNLPAKDKMCEATYRDLQSSDIPIAKLDGGAEARVLAGRIGGVIGAIAGRDTDPVYIDVTVPAAKSATVPVPKGHAGFVYPLEGAVVASQRKLERGELGVLGDGDDVELHAPEDGKGSRIIVIAGKPLGEPVVQYGPFVMNTPEQIEEAIRDFRANRF
jgi:redox-sensitive bicupin YhaK (pirin superfamily)